MGWLFAWSVFGTIAAYELGELAKHGSDGSPVLMLGCGVVGVTALAAMTAIAVKNRRPDALFPLLVASLACFALCTVWWLYRTEASAGHIPAAMAGAAYLLMSFCTGCVGVFVAWRRRESERMARANLRRGRNGPS